MKKKRKGRQNECSAGLNLQADFPKSSICRRL